MEFVFVYCWIWFFVREGKRLNNIFLIFFLDDIVDVFENDVGVLSLWSVDEVGKLKFFF